MIKLSIRDALFDILNQKVTLPTSGFKTKLEYEYGIDIQVYAVRALLRGLEKEGLVEAVACRFKNKIKWRLSNTKGKTLYN